MHLNFSYIARLSFQPRHPPINYFFYLENSGKTFWPPLQTEVKQLKGNFLSAERQYKKYFSRGAVETDKWLMLFPLFLNLSHVKTNSSSICQTHLSVLGKWTIGSKDVAESSTRQLCFLVLVNNSIGIYACFQKKLLSVFFLDLNDGDS